MYPFLMKLYIIKVMECTIKRWKFEKMYVNTPDNANKDTQ